MKKRALAAAVAAASFGLFGTAVPSSAKAAEVTVSWQFVMGGRANPVDACVNPKVTSTKDISNIVYVLADGTTHQIEYADEEQGPEVVIAGEVVEIWVKSGNNHSDSGSGLGDHFVPVTEGDGINCTDNGGGEPPN